MKSTSLPRWCSASALRCLRTLALAGTWMACTSHVLAAETIWLDSLNLSSLNQPSGHPATRRSTSDNPLSIAGTKFAHGVATHVYTPLVVMAGGAEEFVATVGLDDSNLGRGSIDFQLVADGKKIFDSGVMNSNSLPKQVDVPLHGAKMLEFKVRGNGGRGVINYADWAEAKFMVTGATPKILAVPAEKPYILTPSPGPAPRINGPVTYGARPGHPFLYRIPTQGLRPMIFSADGLPPELTLDARTGIISGTTPRRGDYLITFHASNKLGADSRTFKLVSGDTLALTPPMGFNDWYAYYDRVSDKSMRTAADIIVSSGMADVGYQYVDIDDCWMNSAGNRDPKRNGPFRDAAGNLLPNVYFPGMRALTDDIHSKGLKAGIYISPGPLTCAGFAGSYQHEAQDAKQFSDWGFDLLKYDWCTYGRVVGKPPTLAEMKRPYLLMGGLLKQQARDIQFNLCQYGMGEVWKWGAETGGQSWRTAGDLGGELNNIFGVALKNCEHRKWQKPGAWNDPDYLQIGYYGTPAGPKPFPLTPTEQYSFMSLWCLMAAPLFYSGEMDHLDKFTLNILCNPEVIDVDQDPQGECARVIKFDEDTFLMVKDMTDGSKVVGFGNCGDYATTVNADWQQLGLSGTQRVRDLWREKNLGNFPNGFKTSVPRHGMTLVRLWPVKN